MSSTLSPVTAAALLGTDYDAISATFGLSAILLLVWLLVGKEIARARGVPARVVGAFDAAVVPLLMAASVVMSLRLLDLLG